MTMDPLTLALAAHVPAAARGDRDAFAHLVDGTRSVVGSIALAIVRDAELARDVAQEVFLAAWRDLGSLRDPHSLLPWLRQMTRHRAYHVLRTERRRARRVTTQDTEQLLAMALDPRPHAGAAMLADEERQLFEAVFDELPDAAREVVTLYYREGESTAHVADLLGLSEANVRQRLTRARTKLRGSLLERFGSAARRTAPDATLTTAVLTALAVGAPTLASATTLPTASTATASGLVPALFAKLLAIGGGALLGAAGGIAGVLFGTRQLKRQARFPEELHALRRFERTSVGLVLVAAAIFPISWQLTHQPWSQVATFAAFLAGLGGLHLLWLPRILRARRELEAAEDPVRAARARARERRLAVLGWTLGILSGTAGLVAGLLLSAR
jgi:RNA polymerase sigma factor (sigma-70 family)